MAGKGAVSVRGRAFVWNARFCCIEVVWYGCLIFHPRSNIISTSIPKFVFCIALFRFVVLSKPVSIYGVRCKDVYFISI